MAKHGHSRVSRSGEDASLGEWVKSQRRCHKQGTLQQDRIDQLNSIGFVWDCEENAKKASFEDRLEECRNYRRTHGHLTVPPPLKGVPTGPNYTKEESSFRRWARNKRQDYHKFINGQKSRIDKAQIKKLEDLGFDFTRNAASTSSSRKHKQEDCHDEEINTQDEDFDTLTTSAFQKSGLEMLSRFL